MFGHPRHLDIKGGRVGQHEGKSQLEVGRGNQDIAVERGRAPSSCQPARCNNHRANRCFMAGFCLGRKQCQAYTGATRWPTVDHTPRANTGLGLRQQRDFAAVPIQAYTIAGAEKAGALSTVDHAGEPVLPGDHRTVGYRTTQVSHQAADQAEVRVSSRYQ